MKHRHLISLLFSVSPALFGYDLVAPVSGVYGETGHRDGAGGGALFSDPMGMARDFSGNLYVCDARNHVIRKISPVGVVTTLAGKPGAAGAADGTGFAARLNFPADIAVSPTGMLYVADSGNHCIRVITPDGSVRTLAGNPGNADGNLRNYGSVYKTIAPILDGRGISATFNTPSGIAYDPAGFLYVSDTGNHLVRKVDLNGTVSTVAGMPGEWGDTDGIGKSARFNSPMGLCVAPDGNLYIADSLNHVIRRMSSGNMVMKFSGISGSARFSEPTDIVPDPGGGFIVCDSFGNSVFRLSAQGNVSVLGENAGGQSQGPSYKLSGPSSAVCDAGGNVYIADTFNQQIIVLSKLSNVPQVVGENLEEKIAAPHDFPSSELAVETPKPVVERRGRDERRRGRVVEITEQVVKKPEPVANNPEPVVEEPDPVVETPEPMVEKRDSAVEESRSNRRRRSRER